MTLPRLETPAADDIDLQLRRQARLKGISRVLRGLGLMRLEDTPDVGLKVFKTRMAEAPLDILGGLRRLGRSPDSETFLRSLKPDIDEDGLESIFGKLPPVKPLPISPVSARVTAPFQMPAPPVGELKPLAPSPELPPQPPPQPPPPKEVPTFSQWAATKGFDMAEYGSMLRGRGVPEADIPEMLLITQKGLRDVYEFEFGLGRWGTAGGELEKVVTAEPQRIPEVAKVFGQSLTKVPKQLGAAILQAAAGQGGASVVDKDWTGRLIEEAQTDVGKFTQEISEKYPDSKLMESIAQLPQNIAFSLTSMGAGVVTGVPIALLPVPGARIAAWGIGSAASGVVAYNMTAYQIMQQYLEAKNEEMITTRGSGITAEEEKQLKADFEGKARAYGLWEAVPEAISNLAFARILTAPLTRVAGRSIAARIVEGLTTMYGQELLTETITQKGQSAIEVEAGLREGRISWTEAFKEIAPQTFLLTTILGGVGSVSVASVNKVKQSLKTEIGPEHPLYQTLLNGLNERLTEVLQEGAMAMGGGEARLSQQVWDAMPVADRVAQATQAGLSGQVGSKSFEALTVAERTALGKVVAPVTPAPGVINAIANVRQRVIDDIETMNGELGFGASQAERVKRLTEIQSPERIKQYMVEILGDDPTIRLYRGIGAKWAEREGKGLGQFWTSKRDVAEQYARGQDIYQLDVKASEIANRKLGEVVGGREEEYRLTEELTKRATVVTPAAPAVEEIQPTEIGEGMVTPSQPSPVPIEAGGEGAVSTTLPPEIIRAEPAPAVTAEEQAQRVAAGEAGVPPISPSPVQPPFMPGGIPTPSEGRPRTLTDLNREAKGMRALTPEERADVMDMAKPIDEGELLYKVKPFNEHGDILLQPDKPINKVLRSVPGIKQLTEIIYPAQMERDNPVALIGIKKRIFEEIETGRARLASLKWWYNAKKDFDFKKVKGKWRATNIELSPEADPAKSYHATIHDLIEHPENYRFTDTQSKILKVAQDMQNELLRDAQRTGVDAVELSGDYWRRIVTKAPKNALFDGKIKSRITSKKGYTRQRAFDFVDDGAALGFEYETHPLRSLQNRLEAGVRTISDQSARKEIAKLPGVVKALERLESRYPQTLEGVKTARQARDIAKQTFLRDKTIENETALRQAEADYINSMREFYFKKIAVGQPNIGELKLPNGRIAPVELAEEISRWIELPEFRTGRGSISNPILGVTQLLRSTLTNVDLAAGFIQGQALFYRNNPAWWVGQGNAILSLVDDRMAYVEKNFDVMDEGMRMGAISIPTEFMFTTQGLASIPTRVPVVGPVMKAFNRAFEWFIVVGQTEMYKAARSGVIRRAAGVNVKQGEVLERRAIEALTSLGSAIRKELGTESYAILGVRPTQHTIEQLVFFAARFFRAMTGIQAQAFTGGEGGREARRAMGSLIAGGLALLLAAAWITEKKLPNMTDPFAPGWMMFKVRNTYFTPFGPFYPYFRAQARASVRLAQGEPGEAAKVIARFLESKEGLLFRGIDMAAQFAMYGSYRTFEGKRLPATPLGIGEAVLGEMAVPISIQEAMTALPEGRYESLIGEVGGLVGRPVRLRASTEAISKLGQVDQEALDKALKDVTNEKKIAEIKAKDWTFDIQSLRRDIASGTKYLLEQDIAKLEPSVGAYWQFAEQKDEYETLSTEEKKKYSKDNPDFVANRIFWGELTEIPDLATANAVTAKAQAQNIPLNMLPAFQLTDKGKERIPSNRELWKPYFDYYALPGNGGYLSYSKEQVDAGKLPAKYLAEWDTYHKLKTDTAKTLFRKNHKEVSTDWREDLRRKNSSFDKWLIDQGYNQPLKPKTTTRLSGGGVSQPSIALASPRGGGFTGGLSPRRRKATYPKFKRIAVSRGMSISAPGAPRV